MSDRIPCCINGCKRTFPAAGEAVICGGHWRGVKRHRTDLAKLNMEARARLRKYLRRWPEPARCGRKVIRLVLAAIRRDERRWELVVREAQRQQDAGLFQRKPPRRRRAEPEVGAGEKVAINRFEANFQRLKGVSGGR